MSLFLIVIYLIENVLFFSLPRKFNILGVFLYSIILFSMLSFSRPVVSDSVRPQRQQPTRLACPWDSPGKNIGAGCHFLLQCMKVKSEVKSLSCVSLLATPWTAAYQAPPSMGFSRQEYWSGVPWPSLTRSPFIIDHHFLDGSLQ